MVATGSSVSSNRPGPTVLSTQHPSVFVSYAHADRLFVTQLEKFSGRGLINLAEKLGVSRIGLWSDSELRKSQQWEAQLDQQLAACAMGLVVASADSLRIGSYVSEKEIPALAGSRAVEGIPSRPWTWLLYRSCAFDDYAELTANNALISPDKAVQGFVGDTKEKHYRAIKDALLHEIERCIRDDPRLSEWQQAAAERTAGRSTRLGSAAAGANRTGTADDAAKPAEPLKAVNADGPMGELFGVPSLPVVRVERADLVEQVTSALRLNRTSSITVDSGVPGMGLTAGGGFGKSVLASLVAHNDAVRRMFPDGIVWVTVGESPDIYEVLCDALGALGHDRRPADLNRAQAIFRELISSKRALLILDDVWQRGHARPFMFLDGDSRLLLTSRDSELLQQLRCESIDVEALSPGDAWDLLVRTAAWVDVDGNVEAPAGLSTGESQKWADSLGRVPLPISILGAALKGADTAQVRATLGRLERAKANFGDHPYADVFSAIRASIGSLSESDRRRFDLLAIFPEDTEIPLDVTGWLWGTESEETRAIVERLSGLLTPRREGEAIASWSVHDHVRDFLLYDVNDLEAAHSTFVSRLESLRGGAGWADVACRSTYVRQNLLSHLLACGRSLDVARISTEPGWVICRVVYDGVFAARTDIERVGGLLTTRQRQRILSALEGWTRLLRSCAEFFVLAGQPVPSSSFGGLLAQAEPSIVAAQISGYAQDVGLEANFGALGLRWSWYREGGPALSKPSSAQLAVFLGHDGEVDAVGFSPDGGRVVSGGVDGLVRVWDLATGVQVRELAGHEGGVTSVGISPDGGRVVSGGVDGLVRVWDLATGVQVRELAGHEGGVTSVGISPDGGRVVSGGVDGSVRVWDVAREEQLLDFVGHRGRVNSVEFSWDGDRVASGGDGSVRVWDAVGGMALHTIFGHGREVTATALSPDGARIASGSRDGGLRIWETGTEAQLLGQLGHSGGVSAVAFSPDGRRVLTGGFDGVVRVWDASSGAQLWEFVGHRSEVTSVRFSWDGARIGSGGVDGSVRVWEADQVAEFRESVGRRGGVSSIDLSRDGAQIVSGHRDGFVRLWDSLSGAQLAELQGHCGEVNSVSFSADNAKVVSGGDDGSVRVWDSANGEQLRMLTGHDDWVWSAKFSPDGERILSVCDDGLVRVWDSQHGAQLGERVVLGARQSSVAISPDCCQIAYARGSGSLRVRDVVSGSLVRDLDGQEDSVTSVEFSPDGTRIVSGGSEGMVRVWGNASGAPLHRMVGHRGEVNSVAFSPDGERIVSGGEDGLVCVWDAEGGDKLAVVRFYGEIQSVAIGLPLRGGVRGQRRLIIGCGEHVRIIRVGFLDEPGYVE